jgi:hypothetical protein
MLAADTHSNLLLMDNRLNAALAKLLARPHTASGASQVSTEAEVACAVDSLAARQRAASAFVFYSGTPAAPPMGPTLDFSPPAAARAAPAEDAAWRGRMAAAGAELGALRGVGGAELPTLPHWQLAAAARARVAPRAGGSSRHVATAWGLRAGRAARGACAPPPREGAGLRGVDAQVAGRKYWRYLEFVACVMRLPSLPPHPLKSRGLRTAAPSHPPNHARTTARSDHMLHDRV